MNAKLKQRLETLRRDQALVSGRPFDHFLCPILYQDVPAELCMGHVVNRSFDASSNVQVVQRRDVDNFYGTIAESEMAAFLRAKGTLLSQRISAQSYLVTRPKLTMDGADVEFHLYQGHKGPNQSLVELADEGVSTTKLVVHQPPSELLANSKRKWEFVVERDCRVPALATLIKAAHLTLFWMCGYTYVNTAAGQYVGRQILGEFYLGNCMKSKQSARLAADSFFYPFANMVKPVLGNMPFKGTVDDQRVMLVYGSSGSPFGIGVFIRTGVDLHCVLVPAFGDADRVPTYLDFLKNPCGAITVQEGKYDPSKRVWECPPGRFQANWEANT